MEKIWTMWWQGEKSAPSLVKMCIASMRKYSGEAEVIVIDQHNYINYINIEEFILEKFKKCNITITHLSDIIRIKLIRQYGGIWIDSTVLVVDNIPPQYFKYNFFSIKNNILNRDGNVSRGRWTSFLIGGTKNNLICSEIDNMLMNYLKHKNLFITYFQTDFLIDIAFKNKPEAACEYDKNQIYHGDIFYGEKMLNDIFTIEKLKKYGIFHKLSWKKQYNRFTSDKKKKTLFGLLLEEYGLEDCNEKKKIQDKTKIEYRIDILRKNFAKQRIKEFGLLIAILNSMSNYCIYKKGKFFKWYNKQYNRIIEMYLKKYIKGK